MPVLPMKDTIYQSSDGTKINHLLERSTLFAGQAPEAFRLHQTPYPSILKQRVPSRRFCRDGTPFSNIADPLYPTFTATKKAGKSHPALSAIIRLGAPRVSGQPTPSMHTG